MLDSFRSLGTTFLAKLLLAFLVLSFGVWGIGDMLRSPSRNMTVAKVGGTVIGGDDLMRALHRESENMRRVLGDNYSPEMLKSMNLPPQVLHKLINRRLIKLEAESLGLIPSDVDVVRRIRINPAFQDDKGSFNKAAFEAMLKNTGQSEKTYVEQLRQDMAAGLLIETLTAATPVPEAAPHTLLAAREERREVTIYSLNPSLVNDLSKPDDKQLKSYYDSHGRDFTVPEYRTVSYVVLTNADAKGNATASETDLKKAYKERIEEFKHPERRTVDQLLYSAEDQARKAAQLIKAGKTFAQAAQEVPPLNKTIALGKVERNGVPEGAADAVFALHIGGVTDPIQTPFGWHIFRVTAVDEPSVATFEEARPALEKEMKEHESETALTKFANKLEDTLAGGSTLTEAARDMGLKVLTLGPVDQQGNAPGGGKAAMPELDKFLQIAFKTDEKTDSSLIPAKGGSFYLVHVDHVTPEHLRPLDEVKDKVLAGWQKEERITRLGEIAGAIATKFGTAAGRSEAIAKYSLQASETSPIKRDDAKAGSLALPPQLVSDTFSRPVGGATGAYPAETAYLIATINRVIPAAATDKDTKLLAETHDALETAIQNEILEQYVRYLAGKYTVTVNDAALKRLSE